MGEPVEAITAPDFSGKSAARFAARALFFMAAWMEYADEARSFPLHLACIGEPPLSVRWLADRGCARVTGHSPLGQTIASTLVHQQTRRSSL